MVLVDTSAWVEFLRGTDSTACERVDALLAGHDIATCHPVRMELLAGARDESQLESLRRLLARARLVPTLPADFEQAALLYRVCRRRGEKVRRFIDCLIAAHATRSGLPILHADSDFDVLARNTGLAIDAG